MRFILQASLIMLSLPAFAAFELPSVNPARSVSALDLYGVPPSERPVAKPVQRTDFAVPTRRAIAPKKTEYLIPNKPTTPLWAATGAARSDDPPLRMPREYEYAKIGGSDFFLPEESLDDDYGDDYEYSPPSRQFERRGAEPSFASARPAQTYRGAAVRPLPDALRERPLPIRNSPEPRMEYAAPEPRQEKASWMAAAPTPPPSRIRSYRPAGKSFVPEPVEREWRQNKGAAADDDDEFAYKNAAEIPLTKLSPAGLKRAFNKTFTTENKHLSAYSIEDKYDEISERMAGFDSSQDLSEQGGIRPLEVKISFNDDDSALSRDNYNLLTEYAGIVAANPKRAVQISISERGTRTYDGRKLAARRLAIIEQVLKDSGIIGRRIIPVLSDRRDDSFVLRVISSDMFQTLTEKKRDMFGDTVGSKTQRSMSW